jgi:hypothetical protein
MRGIVDGTFVRHSGPQAGLLVKFKESAALLLHGLNDRLADQYLGVLWVSTVQRTIRVN